MVARCAFDSEACACSKASMSKLLALVIIGLMVIQLIRPLALPGLRQRRDLWKLAVAAMAAISLTVVLRHVR
jgi:hypothetical protein